MQCLTQIIDRSMNEKLLLMSSQRNFFPIQIINGGRKSKKENKEKMKGKMKKFRLFVYLLEQQTSHWKICCFLLTFSANKFSLFFWEREKNFHDIYNSFFIFTSNINLQKISLKIQSSTYNSLHEMLYHIFMPLLRYIKCVS